MTDASGGGGEAYLGLDFGTSNTAVSYIDRNWVELFEHRRQDTSWRELGELVELLPAPLAIPLARYVGDVADASPVPPGVSFLEAALCLAAYLSYAEFCSHPRRRSTSLLKGFVHRSGTYLWHFLKEVQLQLGDKARISAPFHRLLEVQNAKLLDEVLRQWAGAKHEKSIGFDKADLLGAVRLLANISHAVFQKYRFGFFQSVQKERLSKRHSGRFRIAHGKPPYGAFAMYSGTPSFSESDAFVLDLESGAGIPLSPLVFWYPCAAHPDHENGHCFFLDKVAEVDGQLVSSYKATGHTCTMQSDAKGAELSELTSQLGRFRQQDGDLEEVRELKFTVTPQEDATP
jgi:hypothetical protein